MRRLQDKVAVITGGSGGIGKETAARFLEEGASVVLVDIDQAGLDATAKTLGGGERVLTAKADVSNEDDVERYVRATLDQPLYHRCAVPHRRRHGRVVAMSNSPGRAANR